MQVDETYVGGKEKNKHADKKLNAGRGAFGKVAVVGMRDENGQVRAKPVKNTNVATLVGFITENAPEGGEVVTDEFRAYNGLAAKGHTHKTVDLSRFCAAPSARLSHFLFEGDGAFPA